MLKLRKTRHNKMTTKQLKIFKSIPKIKTERLTLRAMSLKDLDDVFEYASDPLVSEHLLWQPHLSKSFTSKYINAVLLGYKRCKYFNWAIEIEGKMIGTCGFTAFDLKSNSAEIGYVINRTFWHNGIAKEAARAVIEYGFSSLMLDIIKIRYMDENPRSAGVALSLGMSTDTEPPYAIICKDMQRLIRTCSITREQYEKQNRE